MSLFSPSAPAPPALPPTPAAPPPPPAFGMIQGAKPSAKPTTATFLGGGDIANPARTGPGPASGQTFAGKTLLGT